MNTKLLEIQWVPRMKGNSEILLDASILNFWKALMGGLVGMQLGGYTYKVEIVCNTFADFYEQY